MLLYAAEPAVPILPLLLAGGILVDAVFGDMRWLFRAAPHPVALVGGLAAFLEKRLNRPERSTRARTARGILVVLVLCAIAAVAGALIGDLVRRFPYAWAVELFLVGVLLAQRSLFAHVRAVRRALAAEKLPNARRAVSHIVGRDPNSLDRHGVARAAIESLAENFADGVVAPAFWYLLIGLPGLFVYKTVNTLDSMIGYRSPRHAAFGRFAAGLDDVMNLVPARLAGLLIAVGALFAPRGRPLRSLRIMWRDSPKTNSPNAGWPEAAMAGAIGVALHGPRKYGDRQVKGNWLGEAFPARATAADVGRALYVYGVACVLQFATISGLAVVVLRA